jgi:hypothetical protein
VSCWTRIVESPTRADVFEQDLQISVARPGNGVVIASTVLLRSEWITVA